MTTPHKVLAFAASNSRNSINKMLVLHAANVLKEEVIPTADIRTIDLNDFEMPVYSIDRENESGIPQEAKNFYKAIGDADTLLISYAEYNFNYQSAFKNIVDWYSRIKMKIFQNKPMVIMATSPGPNGGSHVLKAANDTAGFFGADIRGSLSVPSFYHTFDTQKERISDAELAEGLRVQLIKLAAS